MLIWADGFDHYGTTANLHSQGLYGGDWQLTSPVDARTGDGAIYTSGFFDGQISFPRAVGASGGVGFAFKTNQLGGDRRYSFRSAGGAPQFSWQTRDGGVIALMRWENQDTIYASPAGTIQLNSWQYLEFFWRTGNPFGGHLELRLNGAVLFVDDNGFAGNENVAQQYFRVGGGYVSLDDYVIYDTTGAVNNGPLGDVRCRTIFPDADGPLQQWPVTGDASAHAALAHVPPDVAAHYVAGQNVGDAVDVALQDLPINTAYVFGVLMCNQLSKTDAGGCTVQPALLSGAGSTDGTPVNPGVGTGYYQSIFEADPNGGGPWTKAAVNATRAKLTRSA